MYASPVTPSFAHSEIMFFVELVITLKELYPKTFQCEKGFTYLYFWSR
jgi:hypothetical protein